ncbi:MAG: hypothetical protein J5I90_06885 [Caldilineales bacterium]|nr:hypothetical protein [Caldilineales bacterium]
MTERTRLILIGAGVGATLGLVAAFVAADALTIREQEAEAGEIVKRPGVGDWVKFSVAALTLLRTFADLMSPKLK